MGEARYVIGQPASQSLFRNLASARRQQPEAKLKNKNGWPAGGPITYLASTIHFGGVLLVWYIIEYIFPIMGGIFPIMAGIFPIRSTWPIVNTKAID